MSRWSGPVPPASPPRAAWSRRAVRGCRSSRRAAASAAASIPLRRRVFRSIAAPNGCIRPTATRCQGSRKASALRCIDARRNGPRGCRAAVRRRRPKLSGWRCGRRKTRRGGKPHSNPRTARWRARSSPAAAGTSCSMRAAPGAMARNSTGSRSRTMSATTKTAPTSIGGLFERLAEGLPIAFDSPVTRIDDRGRSLRLDTPRGTLTAARVIVTVPTSIIAAEAFRFEPALPDKVEAAAGLPLGVDNKAFIALGDAWRPEFAQNGFLVGSTRRRETMNYQLRPMGRPVIYTFFGGRFAAAMERAGPAAIFAFAADELAALLGADIRRHIALLTTTAWLADPWSR